MERILSASAVGSMREEIRPRDVVVIDQFIDRTRLRDSTFFGDGVVAHISLADPICEDLQRRLVTATRVAAARVHDGGTYLCMEGPLFSTRAESNLYRLWGVDVIGMTNLQEAKLAREAEIAYSTVALATDYDCWHEVEADVNVEDVIAVLQANAAKALELVAETARLISERDEPVTCEGTMQGAIISHPSGITEDARRRLELLIGKYLG